MKRCHIIPILILFTSLSCKNKNKTENCDSLKKGKFGFYGNESNKKYFIERNDSTQIETDEDSGSVMEFYIKWPSPCEYDLIYKRHIRLGTDSMVIQTNYPTVHTKILEIGPDYYVFKSTVVGKGLELVDTMGINKSK